MNAPERYQFGDESLTRADVLALARAALLTADELNAPIVTRDTPTYRTLLFANGDSISIEKIPNDQKYGFCRGLANLNTGKLIPADEPVFILRGQDIHALAAIETYITRVQQDATSVSTLTVESAGAAFRKFSDFASAHPERMKAPS